MTSVYSKAKNTRINGRLIPMVPEKKSTRSTGKPLGRPKKKISDDLFADEDEPFIEPSDVEPDRYDGMIEPEEIPEPIRHGRPNIIMWAGNQYQRTEPEDVQDELVAQEKRRKQLSDAVNKLEEKLKQLTGAVANQQNRLNGLLTDNNRLSNENNRLRDTQISLTKNVRKLLRQREKDQLKPEASKPRGRPKKMVDNPDYRPTEPVKIVEQPFVVDMEPGLSVEPEA